MKSYKEKREDKRGAMSFYDSYDVHNQYYIDRVYFDLVFHYEYKNFYNYNEALLEVGNNEYFLGELEAKNVNKKMCEVALSKNVNVIKFVPKELLGELYIRFHIRRKNAIRKKNYDKILGVILEEIEVNGLSLHGMDFSASDKRRTIQVLKNYNATATREVYQDENESDIQDESEFNVINNNSRFFRGMSYGEVLANINQEGLLLKHIPESSRNIKMCQIAIKQNKAAEKYVPENLMIIINDLKKEAKIMWEYNRRRYIQRLSI